MLLTIYTSYRHMSSVILCTRYIYWNSPRPKLNSLSGQKVLLIANLSQLKIMVVSHNIRLDIYDLTYTF